MSDAIDAIKTKLSSAAMTPVYLCIALIVGAAIFFAVMRWNNDWATKLFLRNLDSATNAQIAEQKKINTELHTQIDALERDNDDLSKKLAGLEQDSADAGQDVIDAKGSVAGKKKSAVSAEFKKLGY
jgi:septal ring factor EnvC (AmiA/AmiB activator)